MSLSVLVFDVGRGLCIAIRTPFNHLIVIDCGTSEAFSPVETLASLSRSWTGRGEYVLTALVITHPHTDHIADIERVTALLPPSIVYRRMDLNWNQFLGSSSSSRQFQHYRSNYLPPQYLQILSATERPDWGDGMTLTHYQLDPISLSEVSNTSNAYGNNSSLVSLLRYRGYTFAFTGDIEKEGMARLLSNNIDLRLQLSDLPSLFGGTNGRVDFLFAPHHGHPSGFCTDWFAVAGPTRICNIVSERRARQGEDPNRTQVDSRYSRADFCAGENRAGRRMVSTRADGHILINVYDNGRWDWNVA